MHKKNDIVLITLALFGNRERELITKEVGWLKRGLIKGVRSYNKQWSAWHGQATTTLLRFFLIKSPAKELF